MNVICSICSDALTQSNDIFYTRCGHVFHLQCLNPWLERSKSCPQCREKVTQSKIHRLYFTFASNDIVEPQASTLQEKIDSLKFQILLKEKDIQYYTSKGVTMEKQNAGLRQEVYKLEAEISQKNAAIHALKEQIEYFKKRSSDCDELKSKIAQLESKIEDLRPIQELLHSPLSDVSKMIGNDRDPQTLIKFISIMKKELLASVNKCKQLRMTVKRLREELITVNAKLNSLLEKQSNQIDLEEGLTPSEDKSIIFQNTDDEVEETHDSDDKCSNVSEIKKIGSKSDISKKQLVEDGIKEGIINETRRKYVIPLKRKTDKTSISTNKGEDRIESKPQSVELESDGNNSDTDFTNCDSSKDSLKKKFKMSNDSINTLDESIDTSSSSKSKKKRKHPIRKKVSDIENDDDCPVIDLT